MDQDTPFEEVLAAAAAARPEACTLIWRRHAPVVAGYLRSRGSREPDDLTSEVFLAAFRALPTFTGGEPEFRGLLFTIARRRLVDEFRTRSRRVVQVPWSAESDPRSGPSAEHEALASTGTSQARQLIESLAPDQRDVLVLRIFGDLTVDQIAEELGKTPGAVKALQRRGLEAVRRRMTTQQWPNGQYPLAASRRSDSWGTAPTRPDWEVT